MRLRALLVLAIVAALLGAPPTASAAGNELHSPAASPTTGTLATVFRLRVSYNGRFPATLVEASVAGLSVPMALVSGSSTTGTFEAAVVLPSGTWPVTFRAIATQGNHPSIAGPTLAVSGLPGASEPVWTIAPPKPAPSSDTDEADEAGGAPATPAPAPAPAEDGAAGDETSDDDDDGNRQADPSSTVGAEPPAAGPADGSGDPVPSRGGRSGRISGAGSPEPSGDEGSAMAQGGDGTEEAGGAAPVRGGPSASPAAAVGVEPTLLADSVRVTAGWAAVLLALVSLTIGALVRRRRRETAELEATAAAAETEALLRRRALRRARMMLPDEPADPIIASMGLDAPDRPRSRSRRARRSRERDA